MFRTAADGLHFTMLACTFSTELLFLFCFSDRKAPNVIIGGHFEFVTCSPLPTGCFQLIYEYLGLREQALVCSIENFVCGCMPTCVRTYVRTSTDRILFPSIIQYNITSTTYPSSNSTNSSTINSMIEMFSHGHAVFVPA